MLARIIEAPLKSSVKNDNPELSDKLMMIKQALVKEKEEAGGEKQKYQQKAITSGVDFFDSQQKHLDNLEKNLESGDEDSGSDDNSGEYESEDDS